MKRRKRKAAQVFISGEEFCNSRCRRRETRRGMDITYKAQETDFGSPLYWPVSRALFRLGELQIRPAQEKISYYPLIKMWLPQVFMKL